MSPSIRELIAATQKQMMIDLERRTSQIPHMGERGAAREDVVRGFLRDYLPDRFEVSHGFVIDADGGVSRQMDCIIFDKASAPVFPITDSRRLIPIECVSAVVSIKSDLRADNLREAFSNVQSALRLNRFAGNRGTVIIGGSPTPFDHVAPDEARAIFGAVFAFDSPSLASVAAQVHELNASVEPRQRIGLVCVLAKGVVSYLNAGGLFMPSTEEDAVVAFNDDAEASLSIFYAMLGNEAMVRVPVFVSFMRYMAFGPIALGWVSPDGTVRP